MKCRVCNKEGTPVELVHRGRVVQRGALCDGCFDAAQREADQHKLVFDGLLEVGVSRSAANAALITLLEGKGAAA